MNPVDLIYKWYNTVLNKFALRKICQAGNMWTYCFTASHRLNAGVTDCTDGQVAI